MSDRSGHGAVRRVTATGGAPVGGALGVGPCAPAGDGTRSGGGRPLAGCRSYGARRGGRRVFRPGMGDGFARRAARLAEFRAATA